MVDTGTAERRCQETVDAIHMWLKSQKEITHEERLGIAKGLLTQASFAIVSAIPGCDERDAQLLMRRFLGAALQFVKEIDNPNGG